MKMLTGEIVRTPAGDVHVTLSQPEEDFIYSVYRAEFTPPNGEMLSATMFWPADASAPDKVARGRLLQQLGVAAFREVD